MILRKNISLTEEYLKKLGPLLEKHNGNLSAVIREVIDLADAAFADPDSVKRLISGLREEQNLTSSTLTWALKNLTGRIPNWEMVINIIGNNISSVSSLEARLNELCGEIYWDSSVKISPDDDNRPTNAVFTITGKNQDMSRYLASVTALFAAKKFGLGVSGLKSINNSFEMEMKKGENEWILESIIENFGYLDEVFSEIYKKPEFWGILITLYIKMNYDMVAIPRLFYEEIMGEKTPKTTICIERFYDCPINRIPHEEFIKKIAMLYPCMGIIKKLDINKDSLIIHHGLTDPGAIKKLADMFTDILNLNGHTYGPQISENLIVMKQQPEVGKILTRMIEDLKPRELSHSDYHKDLLKMLDILKNVPADEEFIKSFGSKFGKKMIQNYEKDRNVEKWDTGTFVNYMEEASAILGQNSNWSNVSENVIHGEITGCNLVKCNGDISITNCMFIKGIFNGWVNHAFGAPSKLVYNNTGQTSACEIYIAL